MRVIGIDPGIADTGYGIVDSDGRGRLTHVASGSIRTTSRTLHVRRLARIFRGLEDLIRRFEPEHLAVEQVFFAKNARAALTLGQARGVALLCAELAGIPVYEYAATEIKRAVSRYGHADKRQVAAMVSALLGLDGERSSHATDALAACICHLHTIRTLDARGRGSGTGKGTR